MNFFIDMLSKDGKISSKRVVGFGAFLLLAAIVIVYLTNYKEIQGEILYVIVGLIGACFGLNSFLEAKGLLRDKPKAETKIEPVIIPEQSVVIEQVEIQSPVKVNGIVESPEPIENADILDGIKEQFKQPLVGIKADTLLSAGTVYLGVSEIKGSKSNDVILGFAQKADIAWYKTDDTPWCAIFVNAMCDIVGLKETKSALAKSFLTWGKSISIEEAALDSTNVIGVFHRGPANGTSGHVAILKEISKDRKYAQMLGGNQSDKVCIQNFKLDEKFIGFRKGIS